MPPTPGDPSWPRRILVVARWYPSHDAPSRGIFVADHVAALAGAGVELVVASWDQIGVRDDVDPLGTAARAAGAWVAPVTAPAAAVAAASWGVPGVPVARLPVVTRGGHQAVADEIAAHAALLVPFGLALAQRWPYELVHAHVGIPDALAAAELADLVGVPLIVTEHSSRTGDQLEDPAGRAAYGRLFGPGRAVNAVGRNLGARIEAALDRPQGTVATIPNPVPVGDFPLGDATSRDPDELLWVGARRESKGMAMLLEAVAEARRTLPALHLRMIGEAPDAPTEDRWMHMATDLGLDGSIAFEPQLDRAGVGAAMRRAGMFVHPSPLETFGMVAAEALASGLPIAFRRSGGVDEITAGAGIGVELADPDDAAGLAAAIVRLRARLGSVDGARLRALVAERYAPDLVAAMLLEEAGRLVGSVKAGTEHPSGPYTGSSASAPANLPGRVVVVGLRRPWAARRIAQLPGELADRLVIVTEVDVPARPVALPEAGRWIEVDTDREYRRRLRGLGGEPSPLRSVAGRALAVLLHPGRARARRQLTLARPALRLAESQAAVALAAGPGASAHGALVIALDAEDIEAAAPAMEAGASLAPGGLRWLADAWAAGRGSGTSWPTAPDDPAGDGRSSGYQGPPVSPS